MVDRAVKGPVEEAVASENAQNEGSRASNRESSSPPIRDLDDLDLPPVSEGFEGMTVEEALERLTTADSLAERDDLTLVILRNIEPGQVPDILPHVERLRHGRAREDLMRGLLRQMAEEQPQAALDYAIDLPLSAFRRFTVEDVLRTWLDMDLEPALEWTLAQPNAALRNTGLNMAIGQLSEENPERALELVQHMGPDRADSALGSIFDRWAATDPRAASRRLARIPAGNGRLSAVRSVAMSWARQNPREALEWAQGLESSSESRRATENVIREFGYNDPAGAFRVAVDLSNLPDFTLENIAGRWAARDPEEAISYIRSLPRGRRATLALNSAVQEVAYERPMEAMRLVEYLEPGIARNGALRAIASELAAENAVTAADWVMQLSSEEERASAINDVVMRWAGLDPEAAARFVGRLPEGQTRENATREMISNWSRHDPAAAARWAQSLGGLRPEVAEDLTWGWAEQDEVSAARWVRNLPPGEARDSANGVMANTVARHNPREAWRWAQRIQDPDRRDLQMERIADDWMRYDRDAALAFVGESELSPEAQARLLGIEEPPPEIDDLEDCCPCELAEEIDIDFEETPDDAEYEGDYDDEEEYEEEEV